MFKHYFNIDELKKSDYKNCYKFSEDKYFLVELYSSKEIEKMEVKPQELRHDVMSYGEDNFIGKFITNYNTIKYLALNENLNKIYRTCERRDKKGNLTDIYQYTQPVCLVENKTQFYVLNFDFDFKYEKYPEIYQGFTTQHEEITLYIIQSIIKVLELTLNLKKKQLEYVWAEKTQSIGYHIYFNSIITNKQLHQYIFNETIKLILMDKKYPIVLINQIFDACVSKANGLRLFYFKVNGDYYYPSQTKSTLKFDPEPSKHFHLCILNTNYSNYNFDLKISQELIEKSICILDTKIKNKDIKNDKLKPDLEYLTDFISLDLEDKKDLFIGLTNILKIERIDDYNNWISLVFLHRNYNLKDNIIKISSKSKKFDSKASKIIENIFNGKTKTNSNPITLGTLISWAKKDNLAETNKLFGKYFLTLKLDIKSIDEILLSKTDIKPNWNESTQYISSNAIEDIIKAINEDKTNCVGAHSPTGTGKTTMCNKIIHNQIKSNPNYKILSVITRRSMSACHLNAFNTSDSPIKFSSYLDESIETMDYFISSLEFLSNVSETYQIVILDEVNSLINYFYSSTLSNRRLQCVANLIRILDKAKLIICVDANITDMVWTMLKQMEKKIYYYKNTFQNKKDIPLNIYSCCKYNEDNNLITWCEKLIISKYISKSKSCLILTDSKEITDKLKLIFIKSNSNEDYYRIFTRDEGTLEDMKNINKVGIDRLLLASPKILYGIDLTIEYDEIFLIYRRTSGLMSLDALGMCQQIGRARKTKAVNILALDPVSKYSYNQYVDYEANKKIQESYINFHSKFQDDLCKKYDVINEMGCVVFSSSGKIKFTSDSFMTEIHYLKTWYDQLFYRDKIDIIRLVAKEYGYKINEIDWNPDIKFGSSLKSQLKLKKEEIIELSKQIYLGQTTDPKYKYYIDNLKEQIKSREKYLKIIQDAELYTELACNQEKFTNWIYKKYMDMDKIEFDKKQIEVNNNEITQIVKDTDLFSKINSCFWLEQTLNFTRYKINDIKCNDIEVIKKIFIKNIDVFYNIFKNNACKERIIKSLKNKINEILNLNSLQKFIADCYNGIINDTIKINIKKIYDKRKYIGSEYVFL
jgi:hypothetical protein